MPAPLDELLTLLDLERIELNIFRGQSPSSPLQRIFGGQVAGQALIAAGRTAPPERPVHSLHAYFVRPGDPEVPVVFVVDRIRDGRSFTTRRVVATQHGKAIFNLTASFQIIEEGVEHADPMPVAPDPESLPMLQTYLTDIAAEQPWMPRPIDVRYAEPPWWSKAGDGGAAGAERLIWVWVDGRLPDDPLLHVCAVTYASDLTLLDSALIGHRLRPADVAVASLDHAMWFHRAFRADEWFLYSQRSPAASGGRGLTTGQIFTRAGDLVVSVVQQGLIRRASPPA